MRKEELDLAYILDILKKRWWIVVLSAILCAALAMSYSKFFVTPMYRSTAIVYVEPIIETQTYSISAESAGFSYAQRIIASDIEILKTGDFFSDVSDAINNKYSAAQLASMVSYTAIENTLLFSYSSVAETPEDALNIANAIKELAPDKLSIISTASTAKVVDPPVLAKSAFNNNGAQLTALGFVLGVVLSLGILILVEMLDIRIKSEDDFHNTYEIPVLGSVPNFEHFYKGMKTKGSDKKRK